MGMTIGKAIELLEALARGVSMPDGKDYQAAIKLGIEALKLIQRERLLGINPVETQLPGESV